MLGVLHWFSLPSYMFSRGLFSSLCVVQVPECHCPESAPSMERPIDNEYATGMDEILTAMEALQITQQKVQAQDTSRSAPVPPKDHAT